jgi:hypothetical protein
MGVFATLNGAMARRPLAAAMVVTTGKAALADIMTQTIIEGTPPTEVDKRRALLFAAFGFGYQGCAQYYMYSKLYERLFPGNALRNVAAKVLASNLISDPVFFFPTFYTMREVINRGEFNASCVSDGVAKYAQNWQTDIFNSWMIWFPGYGLTYGVMPVHLRMPTVAAVSFGYVCLLSFTRGKFSAEEKLSAATVVATAAAVGDVKVPPDSAPTVTDMPTPQPIPVREGKK